MRHSPAPIHSQRGVAALAVTALLLVAMLLAALFAGRSLLTEQRGSAQQMHSTQAFEAAEAGIEWALARLNTPERIGADCQPSTDPAATSFRGRSLAIAAATGVITPAPLQAACVRDGSGWSCTCPSAGAANPTAAAPGPAFTVQFLAAGKPGLVRIAATGCARFAGACVAGAPGTDNGDATARLEVIAGLVGGLRMPPAATVTVRGAFDAGGALLGLHNSDPATGLAVDAGGVLNAPQARVTPPAGSPIAGALVGNDAALAALAPERLFATSFGVDKATWRRQGAVVRIDCALDCATAVVAAVAAAPDGALLQVDGDLALNGPLALGTATRPVTIVVSGSLHLDGAVALHGLLYAGSLQWTNTAGGAFVRGALVSEGGYAGNGAPELFYDAALLGRLARSSGSFARVGGSWRDF